jgi:hypothetical protein
MSGNEPDTLERLSPDGPRFWDAFVVVSEKRLGKVTIRRYDLGRPPIPESTATCTSCRCPILRRATPSRKRRRASFPSSSSSRSTNEGRPPAPSR